MSQVTADIAGASKIMTPTREQFLSSNCHTSNVHMSFSMDEILALCVICCLHRYLSESKSTPRLGRQKMDSIDHVSGLICSLDTRSFLLKDQFLLFKFITCLFKTAFPFSFFSALVRATRTFSMADSHSLKCLTFLSPDTLCVSHSCMIVTCTSMSCLFSQVVFPSQPCDGDTSRVFSSNYCLNSLFSCYSSTIASYACFNYCIGS